MNDAKRPASQTEDPQPRFVEIPLSEVLNNGILLAANEAFFWPLGMALSVVRDADNRVSNLQVREYSPPEIIEPDESDPIYEVRRETFARWETRRRQTMKP